MSTSPFEPGPLNEQTAKIRGLPVVALTPHAPLWANRTEWRWFEPMAPMAIGQRPDGQHGFNADSLDEALDCVERQAVG